MEKLKTSRELVAECNALARTFYRMVGCEVPDDYKFYEASHPAETGCWDMAVAAYEHIEGTPIEDCLCDLEE